MANTIQIKVTGIKTVLQTLESIPEEFRKSGERAALNAGAKPISVAVKANAKKFKDTGLLAKSIGISTKKNKKLGILTARVGPRSGFRQEVIRRVKGKSEDDFSMVKYRKEIANPVKYAHLVEFGTSHSSAQPFLRPAIDASEDKVVELMRRALWKSVTKAMERKYRRSS